MKVLDLEVELTTPEADQPSSGNALGLVPRLGYIDMEGGTAVCPPGVLL